MVPLAVASAAVVEPFDVLEDCGGELAVALGLLVRGGQKGPLQVPAQEQAIGRLVDVVEQTAYQGVKSSWTGSRKRCAVSSPRPSP